MIGSGVTGGMAHTPCAPSLQREEYIGLLAALMMISEPCDAEIAVARAVRLIDFARKAAMQDKGCVL